MSRLLLHAPNVHMGGGLVLLKELLSAKNIDWVWGNLDVRVSEMLIQPLGMKCYFVKPSIVSRLIAEFRLMITARSNDVVLCFHGMPPLLPLRGHVIVFQQNRHYLELDRSLIFPGFTRLRINIERLICRYFKRNVHEYIVQTPSMQSAVSDWHGDNPKVRIIPFMQPVAIQEFYSESINGYDFIYIADGLPHKNHRKLLMAWTLLAQEGIYPSLGLTLSEADVSLQREIAEAIVKYHLKIVNIGIQPHEVILKLYRSARALVFPSTSESFGLPLVEASRMGLPIIASELDFIRDVCLPVQTFDPSSPVSIARAIKRFLNITNEPIQIRSADEFLAELLSAG